MAALLTIPEAAERLGLEPLHGKNASQWLRRFLLRRERSTGAAILTKSGRRYTVSMNAIRRHAPELIDRAEETNAALVEMVRFQKRRDEKIREELADLQASVDVLTEQMRRLLFRLGPGRAA